MAIVFVDNNTDNLYVTGVYASDLMSDVLAYGKSGSILLTGLNTIQAVISAYMAEFSGVVFLRGKEPEADIKNFAMDKGLFIFSTEDDMYEACVKIAGIEGIVSVNPILNKPIAKSENITTHTFQIDGKDFAAAGKVSTQVKTILKSIGYDPALIRRVAIATYEAEMNVVMHAKRANVTLKASDHEIRVIIKDKGKGIDDIERAMQEGFSTAPDWVREMGWGAGRRWPCCWPVRPCRCPTYW